MKKKPLNIFILMLFLALLCIPAMSKANEMFSMENFGKEIANVKEAIESNNSEVAFENSNITIFEDELRQAVNTYLLSIADTSAAAQKAVENLIERKALYQKAISAGITVSDEDFENYKNAVKEMIVDAENKNMVEEYFSGFGGEEKYWSVMEPALRENLAIRKYLDKEKEEYAARTRSNLSDIEFQNIWNEIEEEIKQQSLADNVTDKELEEIIQISTEIIQE